MDGKLKEKYSFEQSGEYFLCRLSLNNYHVYAKIIIMKEGEDPKDPNDGGVISIHHGDDASDEEPIADESADTTSGDDDAVGNFDDDDTEPKDIFDTSDSIEQSDKAAAPQTSEDAAPSSAAPKKSNYAQRRSGGMRNISDTEAATPAPTAHTPQFFNDAMVANTPVEAPRKSKKGPVIVIAITLTVILLVVLAVVLLAKNGIIGGNPNGGGTEYVRPVASNDLRGSFNVYASYFGFGKSSTEKPDMKKSGNKKPGTNNHQGKRQEYEKKLKKILTDDQYKSYQNMGHRGKENLAGHK